MWLELLDYLSGSFGLIEIVWCGCLGGVRKIWLVVDEFRCGDNNLFRSFLGIF